MKEKTPQVLPKVLTREKTLVKPSIAKPFLKAYQRHNVVYRITLTGIFLALVLLFQYFEKFIPFGNTYLKLNFSLIFILPVFYLAGPFLGLTVLILRFVFGPLLGTLGYDIAGIIAHLILLISSLITLSIYFSNVLIFQKLTKSKLKYFLIALSTIIISSLILAILNGFLFTPLFWWAFKYLPAISYLDAQNLYLNNSFIQVAHFGIKSYWGGILAVYLSGNIIKLSLVFIVNYPLSKIINQFLSLK